MTSWDDIQRHVYERAGGRCEYCRMHQSLQGATFHMEHIVPESQGGECDPGNLALACPGCNLRKSDRVALNDPQTGQLVRLYNPRVDRWGDHFQWDGYRVVGRTAIGRATAAALEFNHRRRVRIREAEEWFGLWPPDDP